MPVRPPARSGLRGARAEGVQAVKLAKYRMPERPWTLAKFVTGQPNVELGVYVRVHGLGGALDDPGPYPLQWSVQTTVAGFNFGSASGQIMDDQPEELARLIVATVATSLRVDLEKPIIVGVRVESESAPASRDEWIFRAIRARIDEEERRAAEAAEKNKDYDVDAAKARAAQLEDLLEDLTREGQRRAK